MGCGCINAVHYPCSTLWVYAAAAHCVSGLRQHSLSAVCTVGQCARGLQFVSGCKVQSGGQCTRRPATLPACAQLVPASSTVRTVVKRQYSAPPVLPQSVIEADGEECSDAGVQQGARMAAWIAGIYVTCSTRPPSPTIHRSTARPASCFVLLLSCTPVHAKPCAHTINPGNQKLQHLLCAARPISPPGGVQLTGRRQGTR
jgi:hypothetical protein